MSTVTVNKKSVSVVIVTYNRKNDLLRCIDAVKAQSYKPDNIIVLNDEDGKEVEFEFLDLIEYNSEEYVILLPVEETEEAGEVVILKVEQTENEDEESYVGVEDEDELNAVFAIFKDKFKDEFNFIDED